MAEHRLEYPIRWISFDVDHTLWDPDTAIITANRHLFSQLNWLRGRSPQRVLEDVPLEEAQLEKTSSETISLQETPAGKLTAEKLTAEASLKVLWDHHRRVIIEKQPQIQVTQLRLAILKAILQQWGLPLGLAQKLFDDWLAIRQQVQYFAETKSVLAELARLYPLIAITNGNACQRRTGAERWMRHWIAADQVGFAKPHRAPFIEALKLMQCQPSEVLHVGDHPEDDVKGARAMGMQAAWVNRKGLAWEGTLAAGRGNDAVSEASDTPTLEVAHLGQLLDALTS